MGAFVMCSYRMVSGPGALFLFVFLMVLYNSAIVMGFVRSFVLVSGVWWFCIGSRFGSALLI